MKRKHVSTVIRLAMILVSLPVILMAQGKPVDYEHAANLGELRGAGSFAGPALKI